MNKYNPQFAEALGKMQWEIHDNAKKHGFWEGHRPMSECLCLMHSEISEALEAARDGYPTSDKIPPYSNHFEELADLVIRVLDYCEHQGVDLAHIIEAKHEYNKTRPHKHGRKF
jgi:NTP pyrophosphatase (non-canonical NTP hydrolase)